MSSLGIFISIFVGVGVYAACRAMIIIKGKLPGSQFGISNFTSNLGRLAAISLPLICLSGWIYMLLSQSFCKMAAFAVVTVACLVVFWVITPHCFEYTKDGNKSYTDKLSSFFDTNKH